MKNIQINTEYMMPWITGFIKVFDDCPVVVSNTVLSERKPDVLLWMWCNPYTVDYINNKPKLCPYIVYIRRFEYHAGYWTKMNWDKVDEIVMVNDVLAEKVKKEIGRNINVIYNGVEPEKWRFRVREHGNKIAMVCLVNMKKNFPMALQILAELPEDYKLYVAGGYQDIEVVDYVLHKGKKLNLNIYFEDQIKSEEINGWLEDKNYILCTSLVEGNPNNVLEAMVKGIKPIINNWPGSEIQFGKYVFDTIDQAVQMFNPNSPYDSKEYHEFIKTKFGDGNYKKVRELAEKLLGGI